MVGKRGITPIIATILLIVMTIGIAAFVFLWMQGFVQTLQTRTQQQQQAMQTPNFNIVYAYNNSGDITFTLYNTGTVPIDLTSSDATIIVENYSKITGDLVATYQKSGDTNNLFVGNCDTIAPQKQQTCTINFTTLTNDNGKLLLTNYRYILRITYKGVSATYSLE